MDRIYANVFRALRAKAQLTQADVAKLSGLSQSAISRLEDGNRWPSRRTLRILCKVFDISFEDFFSIMSGEIKGLNTDSWLDDDKEDEKNE